MNNIMITHYEVWCAIWRKQVKSLILFFNFANSYRIFILSEIIFYSAYESKGLEWDNVVLLDDFTPRISFGTHQSVAFIFNICLMKWAESK